MDGLKLNLIVINLKKYSTIDEFNQLLSDNELDNVSASKLLEIKDKYVKIFIDKKTSNIFAVQISNDSDILLNKPSIDVLKELTPISISPNMNLSENLDIDTILDKINETGISSLSAKERLFLNKGSKI